MLCIVFCIKEVDIAGKVDIYYTQQDVEITQKLTLLDGVSVNKAMK